MIYRTTCQEWPALTTTGVSMTTVSGGELFDAVRRDGRWEALRRLGGEDAMLYSQFLIESLLEKLGRFTLPIPSSSGIKQLHARR